ncbi:hypothetical protein ACWEFL_24980 [Streptomyces sp. NPDC004838]
MFPKPAHDDGECAIVVTHFRYVADVVDVADEVLRLKRPVVHRTPARLVRAAG